MYKHNLIDKAVIKDLSSNITCWIEKFGTCEDVLNEAQQRYTELIKRLKNVDNDILNILHTIELEKTKDMYKGWLLYKDIKINREKRREIKDDIDMDLWLQRYSVSHKTFPTEMSQEEKYKTMLHSLANFLKMQKKVGVSV